MGNVKRVQMVKVQMVKACAPAVQTIVQRVLLPQRALRASLRASLDIILLQILVLNAQKIMEKLPALQVA